ncbi:MAG: type II secretion system protein GspM [Myxococcales bacterium]|nr:type II secretion system protein M [Polyangiaceae bacterium]MDW8250653.1 type II secretion system protein GspM [Myxococcales bacterium]
MSRLSAWFAELSPRERRLLSLFGLLAGAFLLCLVPMGFTSVLSSRREVNAELREAIQKIQANRETIKMQQARRDQVAARYAKKAPKLGGFLEQLAKETGVEIPEAQERPETPIGKRYVERSTQIRLRKVGGLPLLRFLEKIEQSSYPLAITRLNVRKRGADRDSFDVEMIVSAYDRNDAPPSPSPAGSAEAP